MYIYSLCLRLPDFVMVNSTWTQNHVNSILLDYKDPTLSLIHSAFPSILGKNIKPTSARIVYPPCPTQDMIGMPLENRQRVLLSIAQFR
jgi:alpha-1,2-mannosyltransferase